MSRYRNQVPLFLSVPVTAALLLVPGSALPQRAAAVPAKTAPTASLANGRKLFVSRCASCHNERGDKPLDKGPPLAERHLDSAALKKTVASRLEDVPKAQQEAVAAYILSFSAAEKPSR